MAANRSLLATKSSLIRSLVRTSHSCPCQVPPLRQRSNASTSFFSLNSRSLNSISTPLKSVASSSSASTSSSNSSAEVSAAVTQSNPALPFSYDPTGLSSQSVKKPSCDNLNLTKSFYRRKLPEDLVSFTSPQGKQLFREMLEEGYGEGYFSLVGNFTTQSETAFCGPSSLAMVLNSLEVDPQRQWKGAWRWYSDELLECCAPAEQVKAKGITFSQFACLSKCHCDVQVRRANQTSLQQFKDDLEMVCSRDDIHMVVSFSRKSLGQTGDGHFSPIGGYVPKAGMVLVLDTARFKYPSYFVSVEKLYSSLFPIDNETGTSRGYFLLSANPDQPAISLCKIPKTDIGSTRSTGSPEATSGSHVNTKDYSVTAASATTIITAQDIIQNTTLQSATAPTVNCTTVEGTTSSSQMTDKKMSWTSLAQTFCKDLPSRIQAENPQTLNRMISVVLQGVPQEYAFWISQQQAHRLHDTTELIDSIRSTELYSLVSSAFPAPISASTDATSREARLLKQQHEGALVFGTLFLMSSPSTLFLTLPSEVSKQFEKLRRAALDDEGEQDGRHNYILKEEAERMRSGIVELVNSFCSCSAKSGDVLP